MKSKILKYIDLQKVLLFLVFILSFIFIFHLSYTMPNEINLANCIEENAGFNGCSNFILAKTFTLSWLTASFVLAIIGMLIKLVRVKALTVMIYFWVSLIINLLILYSFSKQITYLQDTIRTLLLYCAIAVNLFMCFKVIVLNKN